MYVRRPVAAAVAVLTAGALLVGPAVAQEADGPSSAQVERRLSSAADRLAELEAQASLAVEEVNEVQVELDAAEQELRETTDAAAAADERADQLRSTTDAVARSLYKTGGTNLQFGALLSADGPIEAGARYATVQRVLASHRGDVEALQGALTELDTLEDRLATQRDAAATRADELADRRDQLQDVLDGQADEVATLEAELSDARDREEAAARAAAEEAAERAAQAADDRDAAAAAGSSSPAPSGDGSPAPDRDSSPAPDPSPPSTRGSAQHAVDTALAQVGKPYQWGGSGPSSFDCSGLTSFGWRAAGVSLPHSSRMQFSATTRISRGQLQVGDLVFFGSPIHHVAMYIGGGSVVEASRAGVPVRVSSTALGRSDIAGYGRP